MKLSLRTCRPLLNLGFLSERHRHIHLSTCHAVGILLVPQIKTQGKALRWKRPGEGKTKVALPEIEALNMSSLTWCLHFHLSSSRFKVSISVIKVSFTAWRNKRKKEAWIPGSTAKSVQSSSFSKFTNAEDQCHWYELPEGAIFVLEKLSPLF